MNRELIVTLLQKNIQELDMITEGFMEMTEYPKAIVLLAQRKTEDIQSYINQLAELKNEIVAAHDTTPSKVVITADNADALDDEHMTIADALIETSTEVDIQDEIETALEFTSELIDAEVATIEELPTVNPIADAIDKPIEVIVEETTVSEIKTVEEQPRKTVLSEKIAHSTPSRNELLAKEEHTLGATFANKKISDIKQAISIGDRFRFQRELFNSNGEDMNKTLNYINQLATFEEVQSFLESKYKWIAENEAVEDFYQIVRRRF